MPRYFFHISDGQKTYKDRQGADLIDEGSAEAFARIIASDLAAELEYQNYYVEVRDVDGTEVAKLYIATRH